MGLLRFQLFGITQILYIVLAVFGFKVVRNSPGFLLKHKDRDQEVLIGSQVM